MPETTDALLQTALDLLSTGRRSEAIPILQQVVRSTPQSAAAFRALAEAHLGSGELEEARRCCQQATSLDPSFDRAFYLLGVIGAHAGDLDESIAAFERAIALRPKYFDALRGLAAVAGRSGQLARALECYRELIVAGIDHSEILLEFAETAERHGDLDDAITARKILVKRDPDNLENRFNLSSLTGKDPPAVAPSSMVTQTFDRYAETFESHLGTLRYSGPELLHRAVDRFESRSDLRVLDLGCGTGLCGQPFRPMAGQLIGVDLSPRMLDKAKDKNLYDALHCADVLEFLSRPAEYDLIIAADVLIYLGDLQPVFSAAHSRIGRGGRFAFTIECSDSDDVVVSRNHRYLHSPSYVRSVIAETGWQIEVLDECTLRQERGQDVAGIVAVARRSRCA
ncbi:biotin biosynthesis protein BioC [Stieleria neptunia]|uniref:Biotin biosynthesis protein BioC n=1 Tax=Stieleria neptunia TaxID=2527979 RepID=A0A518HXC2_9BACT|nr:tetratricopeptide repeat protein [Stieleria neptunia]QDV45508.1 biotin biosynthesis protein BioC [Stieleria neptunia]